MRVESGDRRRNVAEVVDRVDVLVLQVVPLGVVAAAGLVPREAGRSVGVPPDGTLNVEGIHFLLQEVTIRLREGR